MGINEELNEIKSLLKENDKEKKEKKWKLPFGKKVSNGQKKKGYVTLVKLFINGAVEFKKVRVEDQTLIEDDVPRLSSAGYVFYFNKNPYIFLPEWNVEPFTPFSAKEDFKESITNGTNTVGMSLLLARMLKTQALQKKQISGIVKWIFLAIVILGIGYAFISGAI